jgi:hypothetical protein
MRKSFVGNASLCLGAMVGSCLGIDSANPAPENYDYNEEVTNQLKRTGVSPNAIIYGTFSPGLMCIRRRRSDRKLI